jgi:hypothetical protein
MALDIYVGSLTRYYLNDWETPGARLARDFGIPYEVLRTQSEPDDAVTDPIIVRDAVLGWRTALDESLSEHESERLSWNEELDNISSDDPAEEEIEDAGTGETFERSARFGLEMFARLAELSVRHRLPMKLDY